jgi:malate/lactate dehydrogenase
MKITVVGAGAVGASCAEYIAIKNFASEVVLVDYVDEGLNQGIKFINPNAKAVCGCGESFTL